jgi:hypothetical protein
LRQAGPEAMTYRKEVEWSPQKEEKNDEERLGREKNDTRDHRLPILHDM